jgi:hypothetical protein
MCLISHEHKSICFLPEKTGSTTIAEILTKNFNFYKYKKRHSTEYPSDLSNYFLFGSVRNPFQREISRYLFYKNESLGTKKKWANIAKDPNSSFEDWIVLINNSISLTNYYKNIKLNFFIKLENLKEDFEKLPFYKKLPDSIWNLKRNNKKYKKNIFFTDFSKNIFLNKFKDDFLNFNYDQSYIEKIPSFKSFYLI